MFFISSKWFTFVIVMNRRKFCKIASLALGAVGLDALPAIASGKDGVGEMSVASRRLTARCRVTVLRRECHIDLQSLFLDDPDSGPCPLLRSGEEFNLAANDVCPREFCPRLWSLICQEINDSVDCNEGRDKAVRIVSCPDGTRPVIVRVDRIG